MLSQIWKMKIKTKKKLMRRSVKYEKKNKLEYFSSLKGLMIQKNSGWNIDHLEEYQ